MDLFVHNDSHVLARDFAVVLYCVCSYAAHVFLSLHFRVFSFVVAFSFLWLGMWYLSFFFGSRVDGTGLLAVHGAASAAATTAKDKHY